MHRDILKLERSGSDSVAYYFQMQNKNVRERGRETGNEKKANATATTKSTNLACTKHFRILGIVWLKWKWFFNFTFIIFRAASAGEWSKRRQREWVCPEIRNLNIFIKVSRLCGRSFGYWVKMGSNAVCVCGGLKQPIVQWIKINTYGLINIY